jgi:pyrroloquinoline quinone biosynthesis protein B
LINAPPDLRQQIGGAAVLHPRGGIRGTPIASVILTGAEIDQTLGLLLLREGTSLSAFATSETHALLDANPMFDALQQVERRRVPMNATFAPVPGLTAEFFAVPGKMPLYLEGATDPRSDEPTAGIEIRHADARLVVIPAAAAITEDMLARFDGADVLLFDGTLFQDDELVRLGASAKTARRMGHVPIDGDGGSLRGLRSVGARRIYFHINNTNPIHIAGSPERAKVRDAGWEIAEDGMEIVL